MGPEVLGSEVGPEASGVGRGRIPGVRGSCGPLGNTCFQPVTRIPRSCTPVRITGRRAVVLGVPFGVPRVRVPPYLDPFWTPFGPLRDLLLGRWCVVVMQRDVV